MRDALAREFAALRREARLLDRAIYRHYEARIDNLEKRLSSDVAQAGKRIDQLRNELNTALEVTRARVEVLERGEAGAVASEREREREASRIEGWKVAALGAGVALLVGGAAALVALHP